MDLQTLKQSVQGCTDCSLHENRNKIVFGEGSRNARMVVVGEAPGQTEDETGRPFVGRSGQLLRDNMKQAGIDESDVYILNTVKCRPPNNRDPRPAETEACSNYLEDQLSILNPAIILTVGSYATEYFLGDIGTLGSVVGDLQETAYGPVMPLYHPAFILRQRSREDTFKKRLENAYDYAYSNGVEQ